MTGVKVKSQNKKLNSEETKSNERNYKCFGKTDNWNEAGVYVTTTRPKSRKKT